MAAEVSKDEALCVTCPCCLGITGFSEHHVPHGPRGPRFVYPHNCGFCLSTGLVPRWLARSYWRHRRAAG